MRVWFERAATGRFDYLLASPDEMRYLVAVTPWRVAEVITGEDDAGYIGVLERGQGLEGYAVRDTVSTGPNWL